MAPEPELLIPYYKLSIDHYNRAVGINSGQQDEVAVKASSWSRNLGRQFQLAVCPRIGATPVHHQAAANIQLLYLCEFKANSHSYQQGNGFPND